VLLCVVRHCRETQACRSTAGKAAVYINASIITQRLLIPVHPYLFGCFRISSGASVPLPVLPYLFRCIRSPSGASGLQSSKLTCYTKPPFLLIKSYCCCEADEVVLIKPSFYIQTTCLLRKPRSLVGIDALVSCALYSYLLDGNSFNINQ
jgi:hypothetical protein